MCVVVNFNSRKVCNGPNMLRLKKYVGREFKGVKKAIHLTSCKAHTMCIWIFSEMINLNR